MRGPLRLPARPGRLLDFGCGAGAFLVRAQAQGWDVTGLDTSPAAVDGARQAQGLRALVGTLPHADLEPGSFDLVTMRHSLEHVHDPLGTLREARRLLAPGGRLFVSVPNIDSLPFRWFRHAWVGLDLPRHLTHFAPWTLQQMLRRAGFRPGPVRTLRHRKWLQLSAGLSCRMGRPPRWHHWLSRRPTAGMAAWYCYLTRQADCIIVSAERGPCDGRDQTASRPIV